MYKKLFIFGIIFLLIDQITKGLVNIYMDVNESIKIFDFLSLTYVHNIGAAFSMLEGARWLFIILGTIITVAVALPMEKIAEKLVYSPAIVGILLIITGFVLFYSEYKSKKMPTKVDVDLKSSIFIAIAQGLAALPGFSRSGWTIATGLFNGLDRLTAAKYSFLLSIPIILGASMVYPFIKLDLHEVLSYNWNAIVLGTLVSCAVGYLCIKYFLNFVAKFSLAVFGYYCVIVGILTALFFTIFS